MDHWTLSNELLKIRAELHAKEFSDDNIQKYFSETLEQYQKYFETAWPPGDFYYCSFGYTKDKKTSLVDYRYNMKNFDNYCMLLMEQLTRFQINQMSALSITQMFLHKDNLSEHYKALIYSGEEPEKVEKLDEFIYINLDQLKWNIVGSREMLPQYDFKHHDFGASPKSLFRKKVNKTGPSPLDAIERAQPSLDIDYEFNKLISVYLEIAAVLRKKGKNAYFYFLKPYTFQEQYNVVLLLGMSRQLTNDELETWIDKTRTVKSIISDRAVVESAGIQVLKSISASTHVMKTTTNFLLGAPLNSLAIEMGHDERIQELLEAKDILLSTTHLVNLFSKIKVKPLFDTNLKNALIDSQLFDVNDQPIILNENINRRIGNWNKYHQNNNTINWVNYRTRLKIGTDMARFHDLRATSWFYDILIMTVIENCIKHGKSENHVINIEIELNEKALIFKNIPKIDLPVPKLETGTLIMMKSILEDLEIGSIKFDKVNRQFLTIIYLKYVEL